MANWKHKLELKEDRKEYDAEKISLQQLCERIATKIKALPDYEKIIEDDMELEDIVVQFGAIDTVEEFDDNLNCLYDWGDTLLEAKDFFNDVKQCWIEI